MKAEYEREKLKNDIIIAEKNVVVSRNNEIKLKLKLKTQEYDDVLKLNKHDDNVTEKISIGIQTIEKEPSSTFEETVEATATATPSSAATASAAPSTSSAAVTASAATVSEVVSTMKKGMKRKQQDAVEPRRSKRNAYSKTIYNCYECTHKWAKKVKENYSYRFTSGEYTRYRTIADKSMAPNPKLKIKRFTNIDDYVNHLDTVHGWTDRDTLGASVALHS